MTLARGMPRTILASRAMASFAPPENVKGSMPCSLSLLWLETQFGVEGQGASLPSFRPRFRGRAPVQATAMNRGNAASRNGMALMEGFLLDAGRRTGCRLLPAREDLLQQIGDPGRGVLADLLLFLADHLEEPLEGLVRHVMVEVHVLAPDEAGGHSLVHHPLVGAGDAHLVHGGGDERPERVIELL